MLRSLAILVRIALRRLGAHARTLEALAGRIDVESTINTRQDAELCHLEARVEELERLVTGLRTVNARTNVRLR